MYLYHAHAVALGGTIERPVPQTIPALADCSLPIAGGTSSAKESRFDNGLIAFDSAQSDLTGSVEIRNGSTVYVTGVSVSINGLNVRNMLMADQVVLRIAAEHDQPPNPGPGQPFPQWGEPRIITTGSHFDNLKIAGHSVTLDMVHDVFHDLPTYGDCQADWNRGQQSRLRPTLMGSTLNPPGPNDPDHLKEIYNGFVLQRDAPNLRPCVVSSFVQRVNGLNGPEIDNWGPIIRIPQFGTIYLGEVITCLGHRRVNMFRLQLGSPDGLGIIG